MDLTVQVIDKNGNEAGLPLSKNSCLLPMREGKILKKPFTNFSPVREPVFQYFRFDLTEFSKVNPKFKPEQLAEINFIFNKTEKGIVLLNNAGFVLK